MVKSEKPEWMRETRAPLKLPKSLIKFFRDHEIPQIVILQLGSKGSCKENPASQRFICNSVILALHSEKFERVISAGSQVIFLEGFNDETGVDSIRHCIEFMHGEMFDVSQCHNLVEILQFAESWEISSLWYTCLDKIESEIVNSPIKLLDYLASSYDLTKVKHDRMNKVLDEIICTNADELMDGIVNLNCKIAFDKQIFFKLIANSKTASCGRFVISLLAGAEECRKFVIDNLDIIPHSAFCEEAMLLKFRMLLQLSGINREVCSQYFGKFFPCLERSNPIKLPGQPKYREDKADDNASIMQRAFELDFNHGESQLPAVNDSPQMQGPSSDTLSYDFEAIPVQDTELDRTRLMISCAFPVKDYPIMIKSFSLYAGLEVIAHLVSKRNLSSKNLLLLLLPYFRNSSVAACMLYDLRDIALKRCSRQSKAVQDVLSQSFVINMAGRLETFSVSKHFFDVSEFVDKLTSDKNITLQLDHGVLCEICHGNSQESNVKDSSKKSATQIRCVLQNLEIDLSHESTVSFTSEEEFHRDHIIHCYIVGLSSEKTPISYISIMQLTGSEIVQEINNKVCGVKVVVVFSRKVPASSSVFSGILV